MKSLVKLCLAVALAASFAGSAEAIVITDLGTGAPPAALFGITMTPFPDDPRPNGGAVGDVPSPLGGVVDFDIDMTHFEVGGGWATWSHGYTGDVYHTGAAQSVTMTLPVGSLAFYFYAEPEPFQIFEITASAGGESLSVMIDGFAGANGFGIYDALGLTSITVTSNIDFAVGEFGIANVPEPSTVVLLGLGLVALALRRFRRD